MVNGGHSSLQFVEGLYLHLLHRRPAEQEANRWVASLEGGLTERDAFMRFVNCQEYKNKNKVQPGFPSGHFYSPVVDPATVTEYWRKSSLLQADQIVGIPIDLDSMSTFWLSNEAIIKAAPFSDEQSDTTRYYYNDGRYPSGDAIILMCMINSYRPKHIIEIGSGFSSAVMLDTADLLALDDFRLTCIDPFADRLRSLLRPHDHVRTEILEQQVQTVDTELFKSLEANDILFIDSSHVLKTGSDVHYELFSILPALKPGVLIHFHDIQFPFEYPPEWIFGKRWSWNEIYAVRAFLMYNDKFRIKMFTDYFIREKSELISTTRPGLRQLVGGSLWLEKTAE